MSSTTFVLWLLSVLVLILCSGGEKFGKFDSFSRDFGDTEHHQQRSSRPQLPCTSTGTTIVAICCRDGVVLGADSRSTGGTIVMDKNKEKIHYIAQSIRCCAAGTSADCEYLSNEAKRAVALHDIEVQTAEDASNVGLVSVALQSIVNSLTKPTGRTPSAVFLLGGVDFRHGAQLYQVEGDGTPHRVSYGALGSGSVDALAVLEHSCASLPCLPSTLPSTGDATDDNDDSIIKDSVLDIDMDAAVEIVRRAVQAGILNDLGSGSHVDLCCISRQQRVEEWREHLTQTLESERGVQQQQQQHPNQENGMHSPIRSNADERERILGRRIITKSSLSGPPSSLRSSSTQEYISRRRHLASTITVETM